MKASFIVILLSLLCFSFIHRHDSKRTSVCNNDSMVITHVIDGLTGEWPAERFATDKDSKIQYASDNDANDLFFGIRITSPLMQGRIMKAGMNFYIDLNGKKRESKGVEFPVANDNSPDLPADRNNDPKTIRSMMILNLIKIQVFGFSDKAPPYQELMMPGSVNVAYDWDSAGIMHIEYRIPFSMLGDAATLNQKTISFGWKINPVMQAPRTPVTSTTQVVAVPSGRRAPAPTSTSIPVTERRTPMNEEQQFWAKYLITISK